MLLDICILWTALRLRHAERLYAERPTLVRLYDVNRLAIRLKALEGRHGSR